MENLTSIEMAQKIIDAVKKEYKELTTLNVMILGKTGVGKSTLVNNMFSKKVAETGTGRPVTQQIRKYELPDYPLAIYDTPGLELSGAHDVDNLLEQVVLEFQKGIQSGDISKAIHCVWYCVSTPSNRFEDAEADFLKRLLHKMKHFNVPVIVVLTQSYDAGRTEDLKAEIEKENLEIVSVVPVLAEDWCIRSYDKRKPCTKFDAFGMDTLAEVMHNAIPDAVRKTFVALQIANIELKKEKAEAVVAMSAAATAATAAAPIPFSDTMLLVAEQIVMLTRMTGIFGIPIKRATLFALISTTVGSMSTTVLGKAAVAELIKFIPGMGSVVGGAISGATAAALTFALGEAYMIVLEAIYKGEIKATDIETELGRAEIARIFTEQLKKKRDPNGKPI